MIVAVPKETYAGERRVALTPPVVADLRKKKLTVRVEGGAGLEAGFTDAAYESAGAEMIADRADLLQGADIIVQVRTLGANPQTGKADLPRLKSGQIVIGHAEPLLSHDQTRAMAERGVSLLAMELIPRITRAQSMDALSSQANLAGYKAVLIAAERLPKIFPMMMTAAGTLKPARVFVVGAGVAGLQAIATAKRLGAIVSAYDVRAVVKEQVQSLGAKFVELPITAEQDQSGYAGAQSEEQIRRQRELMARTVAESDVVITTAAIPGRRSPVLITEEMVKGMAPGSVLVDLAAERGGNCEITESDEVVERHGVTIVGTANVPATVPQDASQMYARNIAALLTHLLGKEGQIKLDAADEITAGILVCRDGQIVHPQVQSAMGLVEAKGSGG